MHPPPAVRAQPARFGSAAFYGIGALLVFLAYVLTLELMNGNSIADNVAASLRNLLPLAILTAAVQPILTRFVMRLRPAAQLAMHVPLGVLFALLWYWMLMVAMGLSDGESLTKFAVRPFFPSAAYAWQLLQGGTFYALVAALAYLRVQPALPTLVVADPLSAETGGSEPALPRYFVRQGDEIHPIDVGQIVAIEGADDYAEVVTLKGRHLVRMTLTDFEKALQGSTFIRVHRSRIVNVNRIERAEPAGGGRLLLHMENGEMIAASRAGSKMLRDRLI